MKVGRKLKKPEKSPVSSAPNKVPATMQAESCKLILLNPARKNAKGIKKNKYQLPCIQTARVMSRVDIIILKVIFNFKPESDQILSNIKVTAKEKR